jgi:FixJ family two-component response regulator
MNDSLVYVVDDDPDLAGSVARLLRRSGYTAEAFIDPAQLLGLYDEAPAHCLVIDVMMPGIDGFAFAESVRARDDAAALIFMTAWPSAAHAVDSIRRHGGIDYLEKPLDEGRMLAAVAEGVAWSESRRDRGRRLASLTARERQVFDLLVRGHSNKAIAALLGVSPKTIEDHRAAIVAKTGANGLAQLIALVDE